jgi:hypothetical protein
MTAADKFTWSTYDTLLRLDFVSFAQRCFGELSPRAQFAMNWHIEIIAAKLMALRAGKIRRLIINLPPRYLKSLLASVAFPAWCLGHDPAAQILCVSYAQELADKLSRDCRRILASDWFRRIFPTRLSQERQAVPEFETTAQGCRLATSVGGVLTGRGADLIIIDDPLKPEEALSQTQRRAANEWFDHTLYSRLNDKLAGAQQAPTPLGGGLVKAAWFKHYAASALPQSFDRIVQSWDTANKATELSDYSVCTSGPAPTPGSSNFTECRPKGRAGSRPRANVGCACAFLRASAG